MSYEKIEIEQHKGQTIYYDVDEAKFYCDILIEDRLKRTKRQSLKDVRHEIELFIKLNLDFKPFKFIEKSRWSSSMEVKTVSALRTDGKFVVTSARGGGTSFYGDSHTNFMYVYNQNIVDCMEGLEQQLKDAQAAYNEGIKELASMLQPLDLSKYKYLLNPDKDEQPTQ